MASDKGLVHVIDDDEGLRESLAFLLRTAQIEVKSFASAGAFLNSLPDASLSCVITDVRMPDLSGIDLLRRLKENKIAVPVIVITGHGDVALAVEAMKIGAVDFLEKPFDDEVLLASVEAALRQHGGQARRDSERAEIESRAGGAVAARARRAGRPGGRPRQQADRLRPRHQPANRGDLPGQSDEQDAGRQPVRPGAHGADRRHSRIGMSDVTRPRSGR